MPSPLKILQTQEFTGGVNSDFAPDVMPPGVSRRWLNCNVLSTPGGNTGIVTNVRGNVEIPVPLPPSGENMVIGSALDEESNYLYFAMWNGDGYHSWFRYDHVSGAVDTVFQCRTMTGDVDIWDWPEGVFILSADIIGNNLLSWSMEGQPAREIDVFKALGGDYSGALDQDTRAYKRAPLMAPTASYTTDEDKKYNRLFGNQFRFAYRFHYSTGAKSNWSDWGNVARPDFELFSGEDGVPLLNNAIDVGLETGSWQVTHIEVGMQKTNPDGGVLPWVSVDILDKDKNGIADNSLYNFRFYNDSPTSAIPAEDIIRPYSYLPKNPKTQAYVKNALLYANFYEGFPDVSVDVGTEVRYDDIFLDPAEENELNDPSIQVLNHTELYAQISDGWFGVYKWKGIQGDLVIGPDVEKGNKFEIRFYNSNGERYYASVTAGYSDTSKSIAQKLSNQFSQIFSADPLKKTPVFQSIGDVSVDLGGNASFNFRYWNGRDNPQPVVTTTVNPVSTTSLQDAGQSVQNIKLGSSGRYGLLYSDSDGRTSAVYTNNSMVVNIDTINDLGEIKKPVITFSINHTAPEWAASYQIVRTKNLVQRQFVQLLIQKTVTHEAPSGDMYMDLHLGSLFTYQRTHPNTVINYNYTKGDRLRLISQFDADAAPSDPDWVIATEVKDYEVIDYNPEVITDKDENITLDGSNSVTVEATDPQYIGMWIEVDGSEREITGVTSATQYELDRDFDTGDPAHTTKTYPSYRIINRNGSIRIKYDPAFPIVANPETDEFAIVEIYTPAIGVNSVDDNIYYAFGQKFVIIDGFHTGNIQNQTLAQPAIIDIDEGDSYVRYRELPVSNSEEPTVLVSSIEDSNYSDFYVSDMSDDGRVYALDSGQGEVHFGSRIRWSRNYIEGTKINGLNDFDNLSREDYNDKYGDIELILSSEDRLYVFKHLKTAWLPVYGRRVTTQDGQAEITSSPDILPNMLSYFLWDGGVGDNPESVVRNGNNIYFVSPDSGVFARIGGDGVEPISKTYNFDSETRILLDSAKKSGSKIIAWFDRKNDNAEISIEPHDNLIYDAPVSGSGWELSDDVLPAGTVTVSVTTPPAHGSTSVSGEVITYTPDNGYSGPDSYEYTISVDGVPQSVKKVCITVNYVEGPKIWQPIDSFCVLEEGARTGFQGWNTLRQYDTLNQVPTGITKPNSPSDPDYVAPVYNTGACSPQEQFLLFSTASTSASMSFEVNTGATPVVMFAKSGGSIINTGTSSATAGKTLNLSGNTGTAEVWVRGPVGVDALVTRVVSNSNQVVSENTKDFPNVTWMEFRDGLLTSLTITPATNISLERIIYSDNAVPSFDPSGFVNLYNLTFTNNGVSSMPLGNHPDLEELSGSMNSLTVINTSQCPKLRYAELQFNSLTAAGVDFSNNVMEVLYIASNPGITTLPWSDLTGLTSLTIDKTGISVFDPSIMPGLMYLDITQCPIAAFSINSNDEIIDLRCGECTFTEDDADPSIIDAVIIKMNSNIVSGGVLHYDTITPLGIQPTNASRAAYDSLVVKGTNLQGKVPL